MEVSQVRGISSRSSSPPKSSNEEESMELRRGPWTVEEDLVLMDYISLHGEGRWNSLARCAGLKRTGKSCRLRWLNYLRPDVRRGNISLEEQLLILELHSRWGNRWSKIAQQLPGRTDNEIKNYWRTRVQKHAKQLKCDVNSKQFKDTMRYLWMPRLVERIQAASSTAGPQLDPAAGHALAPPPPPQLDGGFANNGYGYGYGTPENCSSTGASSDSFGPQVSPVSELADNYNFPVNSIHPDTDYYIQGGQQQHHSLSQVNSGDQFSESLISPCGYLNDNTTYGLENFQSVEQSNNQWFDSAHAATEPDNLWNVDDIWFLQQQFGNASM